MSPWPAIVPSLLDGLRAVRGAEPPRRHAIIPPAGLDGDRYPPERLNSATASNIATTFSGGTSAMMLWTC